MEDFSLEKVELAGTAKGKQAEEKLAKEKLEEKEQAEIAEEEQAGTAKEELAGTAKEKLPETAGEELVIKGRASGEMDSQDPLGPGLIESLVDHFPMTQKELKTYSALALAYIGDCVFDLLVRTILVSRGNDKPSVYHRRAVHLVNAGAQTEMMEMIKPLLKDEEMAVFRRGRNAKGASPAKNQSLHDYRIATGFEALLGYLYLSGQSGRIYQLMAYCLKEEEKLVQPLIEEETAARKRKSGRK